MRTGDEPQPPSPDEGRERRRWFGLFFLFLAGGMLIWGQTLLKPHLRSWSYLVYWSACFGLTTLALTIALIDARAVRRHGRKQQRELLHRALEDIERNLKDPPDGSDKHE